MPAFVKYLLIGIIGLICFFVGVTGNLLYFTASGSLDGYASACRMLNVAEQKALLGKEQRKTIAADTAKAGGIVQLSDYLASDCAKSPAQAIKDAAK